MSIAIVGKYLKDSEYTDVYLSISKALEAAALAANCKLDILWVNA